jgi:hypothetical protein
VAGLTFPCSCLEPRFNPFAKSDSTANRKDVVCTKGQVRKDVCTPEKPVTKLEKVLCPIVKKREKCH